MTTAPERRSNQWLEGASCAKCVFGSTEFYLSGSLGLRHNFNVTLAQQWRASTARLSKQVCPPTRTIWVRYSFDRVVARRAAMSRPCRCPQSQRMSRRIGRFPITFAQCPCRAHASPILLWSSEEKQGKENRQTVGYLGFPTVIQGQ